MREPERRWTRIAWRLRDRGLVEAQVGGEAAADVRHVACQRYQQRLARALDLDVAAGLGGQRGIA